MAGRRATISQEALERLGAPALAALVLGEAEANPAFARRVRMELAGNAGEGKLQQEIDRRLAGLARSSRFVERLEAPGLARDLDALRSAISDRLAEADPAAACERLRRLLDKADATLERADDSDGALDEVFGRALADLGRIWGARPDRDVAEMVDYVLTAMDEDEYGVLRSAVAAFLEPLGEAGRALLKESLAARLAKLPAEKGEDWRVRGRRVVYVAALEALADAVADVDAYIAASSGEPLYDAKRQDIAERLLAAGRAEEALARLDECGEFERHRLVDLRLQALDALGRKDEAQSLRWSWFERVLSLAHLKEFVRRLPDFDGFEAERRAVTVALGHRDRHSALRFLLELPDLVAADRLVRGEIGQLDPRHYGLFNLAAERLAGRYPAAAVLLRRRQVEDVLKRASSGQYDYAVRDLRDAAALASGLAGESDLEPHDAWLARLRGEHGRKWRFWELLGQRR